MTEEKGDKLSNESEYSVSDVLGISLSVVVVFLEFKLLREQ